MKLIKLNQGIIHKEYFGIDTQFGILRLSLYAYSNLMKELGTDDPTHEIIRVAIHDDNGLTFWHQVDTDEFEYVMHIIDKDDNVYYKGSK